jgi:hypothetical protein
MGPNREARKQGRGWRSGQNLILGSPAIVSDSSPSDQVKGRLDLAAADLGKSWEKMGSARRHPRQKLARGAGDDAD